MSDKAAPSPRALRAIPPGIWALGLVSLLMDTSSEMIHGLLPVYLTSVLGASALMLGLIEGVAESTALITRIFSGALSDWLGRRKWLAAFGYGLAALSKPVFPLAPSASWLLAGRFVDRVGKGIRGAPRDALIADLAPAAVRGASFGLRQALDTVGAFLGPALAIVLMLATGDRYRLVFWIAVIPAVFCVALIVFGVREPDGEAKGAARFPLRPSELKRLGGAFWVVCAVAALFSLARFSEAFLILKARDAGLGVAYAPLVLVVMNLVYSASAYPAGALSDRTGRKGVLLAGIALLVAADLVLAWAGGLHMVGLGLALWGLHMGFTQGLISTLAADYAPANLRGTAFGALNLATGVATLAASLLAGELWEAIGPQTTFAAGAGLAAASLVAAAVSVRAAPQP